MDNLIFPLSKKETEKSGMQYDSKYNKNTIFPTRLRELRARDGISQQKLADDIGVTKSTISLYEQGDNVPDIKTFKKIADYYNVSYDYLLGKSDSTQREYFGITETTGLSEEAIDTLKYVKENISKPMFEYELKFINALLEENEAIFLSQSIWNFAKTKAERSANANQQYNEGLSESDLIRIGEKDISLRESLEYLEFRLSKTLFSFALGLADELIGCK